MRTHTLHLNHRAVRLGAIALLAWATLAAGPGAASASYGWPVKPFHRQHPVRGRFGDPRTGFAVPPTADGVLHGAGHFSFHEGIDISAPNGTAVYPVRDGRVTAAIVEQGRERVVVLCPDGVSFEYWHLTPRVRVGQ